MTLLLLNTKGTKSELFQCVHLLDGVSAVLVCSHQVQLPVAATTC